MAVATPHQHQFLGNGSEHPGHGGVGVTRSLREDFAGNAGNDRTVSHQKGRTEVRPGAPNQRLGSGLETFDLLTNYLLIS